MQTAEIQMETREKAGKGPARQLRIKGLIPVVLYRAGRSTLLSMNPEEIEKVLHSKAGENTLITVNIQGKTPDQFPVTIVRDYQRDPITDQILHADLFEISLDEPIVVKVPVELGAIPAIGIKEGGILQYNLREIQISCLPTLIPDHILVDVALLGVGKSFYVRDLVLAPGVTALDDPHQAVVSMVIPISQEKLNALLVTTPVDGKEPEVTTAKEGTAEGAKVEGTGKTDAKAEKGKPEAKGKDDKKGKEEKKETKK